MLQPTNTGFYNVSLQYWSDTANTWAGSGEIALAFNDYTAVSHKGGVNFDILPDNNNLE